MSAGGGAAVIRVGGDNTETGRRGIFCSLQDYREESLTYVNEHALIMY